MTIEDKEKFSYEYEQVYNPFDFINKDLDLLLILIFIEGFKEGKREFNFGNFFNGKYWNADDVKSEIMDTNDYYDVPDMVLEHVIFVFEDLRMGNIKEVGIDNIDFAIQDLLIEVAKIGKENAETEAPHYELSFGQLYSFSAQKRLLFESEFDKNHKLLSVEERVKTMNDKSLFFSKNDGYFSQLQPLIIQIPSHIILKVEFNEKKVKETEQSINDYFEVFSKDELSEELPRYQERRLYFAQQIENFYLYISKLNLIGDTINIPFAILQENGFEAVKILDEMVQVKCQVKSISTLSAHADQHKLIKWIQGSHASKVFLNHAEPSSAKVLAEKLQSEAAVEAIVAEEGMQVEI